MVSSLIYLLEELVITVRLGLTEEKKGKEGLFENVKRIFSFNNRLVLLLAVVSLVYCILLINGFFSVELFLPYINLISWIKLVQELAQFEIIRKFLIVFMAST